MVSETAKVSAISAINLKNLLTKQWNEEKGSYFVSSKLNGTQEARVNNYVSNRYIV